MLLTPQDSELLFRLHRTLMFFVNQRLKVLPDELASPEAFSALAPQVRLKVRDAFTPGTGASPLRVDEQNVTPGRLAIEMARPSQPAMPGGVRVNRRRFEPKPSAAWTSFVYGVSSTVVFPRCFGGMHWPTSRGKKNRVGLP
jgi:hypothetical protein